jgi:hypothetical protein
MLASKEAVIIKTKAGPAIILPEKYTRSGKLRKGSKAIILAWLKPTVTEQKKIDFYLNFEDNNGIHNVMLEDAADHAITLTIEASKH